MKEQTTVQSPTQKTFKVSAEFKNWVEKYVGTKSFAEVGGTMNLLTKPTLLEGEINAILAEMAKFTWIEVHQFFGGMQQLIEEVPTETDEAPEPEKKSKK